MRINAIMHCKSIGFEAQPCEIIKTIEVPHHEFMSLLRSPLKERGFIAENNSFLGAGTGNTRDCLLLLSNGCDDGVLIDPQGYNYARYSSFIPNARQIINTPQYECLNEFGKCLSNAADKIVNRFYDYDGLNPYRVLIDEIAKYHGLDENYAPLLEAMLIERGQKNGFDCEIIEGEIFIKKQITQHNSETLETERTKQLLDKALGWLGQTSSGSDLYETLKDTIGMTDEEIAFAGFNSLEKYFNEPEEDQSIKMG
ncbi:MAG: DUF6329 domain-containing protein [Oscillospiraceae bacterium]|nr:DUF6329 domain-containing protein [Oscillospiraceae bacterium]